jgi:hypothetical protein
VLFNSHSAAQHKFITVMHNINTNIHCQLEKLITAHVIISDNMESNSSAATRTRQLTYLFTTTQHEDK